MTIPNMMRTVVFNQFGNVDVLEHMQQPVPIPKTDEVLVKVHTSTVNPKDTFIRKGRFKRASGSNFPMRTGFDLAGVVVQVGRDITDFAVGARVHGHLDGFKGGAVSEYVVVPASKIGHLPDNIPFEQAGISLAGQTALQAIRDNGKLQVDQRICINGASGGVGLLAVQIAKAMGAHVTTFTSQRNQAFCLEQGADEAYDYNTDSLTSLSSFNLYFDVFGNQSYGRIRSQLTHQGRYVTTVPNMRNIRDVLLSRLRSQKAELVVVDSNTADLDLLSQWLVEGKLVPHIDAVYDYDDIAKAHAHIETKHTRGKVIIRIAD